MKLKKSVAIFSLFTATAISSQATIADDSGWYLGGNLGRSHSHINEKKIADDIIPILHEDGGHDSIDTSYKLYAGYQFNPYFSLEGGYFDLGESQFTRITAPAGSMETNMKVRGINLDAVGYVPFTEKFSAFARLGVTRALTQDTFTGTGAAAPFGGKLSDRDTFPKAGLGVEYKFNNNWALRVEGERYRISNAITDHNSINFYSVGLAYRFGTVSKTVKATPVTATPAPAPVAAPRFEKTTISATELFKFDSSEVTPVQPELEKLTDSLKVSKEPQKVNIVGYTDRIGSEEYNQKLSERRAEAVKTYLVDKGVEAQRLVTEGKGEKDPVVQCDEKNREKLIECLQPNRRVQIDQIQVEREVKP